MKTFWDVVHEAHCRLHNFVDWPGMTRINESISNLNEQINGWMNDGWMMDSWMEWSKMKPNVWMSIPPQGLTVEWHEVKFRLDTWYVLQAHSPLFLKSMQKKIMFMQTAFRDRRNDYELLQRTDPWMIDSELWYNSVIKTPLQTDRNITSNVSRQMNIQIQRIE